MSLINDVLRDLDARGAGTPLPALAEPAPAAAARPLKTLRVLATTLLLSAVALPLAWLLWPTRETPAAAATEPPPVSVASQQPIERIESAAPPTAPPESAPALEATAPETAEAGPAALASPAPAAVDVATQAASSAPVAAVAPSRSESEAAAVVAPEPARSRIVAHAPSTAPDNARSLQQASNALSQGRDSEAEQLLRELLARDPDAIRARQSLAALYQRQGRVDAALSLWRAGLARDAGNLELAEPLARALLANNQPAEAAQALTDALPPLPQRSDLYALLAYTQQQAGDVIGAAATYRALLAHDDSQGRWWLGLGIAEESRGDTAAALAAFRRAQGAAGLESSVLRYVEQRIRALAPDPS